MDTLIGKALSKNYMVDYEHIFLRYEQSVAIYLLSSSVVSDFPQMPIPAFLTSQ